MTANEHDDEGLAEQLHRIEAMYADQEAQYRHDQSIGYPVNDLRRMRWRRMVLAARAIAHENAEQP